MKIKMASKAFVCIIMLAVLSFGKAAKTRKTRQVTANSIGDIFTDDIVKGFQQEATSMFLKKLEEDLQFQELNVKGIFGTCENRCHQCIENAVGHFTSRCALMLDWGMPNCVRLQEATTFETATQRTHHLVLLLRWYRTLCDFTGHYHKAFDDSCSLGNAILYGRMFLEACGIKESDHFADLESAMLHDGQIMSEALSHNNCSFVRRRDEYEMARPTCDPEMKDGNENMISAIPDRCRYFKGRKECEKECSGSDISCPTLPPALCALDKARKKFGTVSVAIDDESPVLALFTAQIVNSTEESDLVKFGITFEAIVYTVEKLIPKGVHPDDLIRILTSAALDELPTHVDPVSCFEVNQGELISAASIQKDFLFHIVDPNDDYVAFLVQQGHINLALGFPLDLIFVLDSSSSIGKQNFQIALNLLTDLVDLLHDDNAFNSNGIRVAQVTFSSSEKTRVEFEFLSEKSQKNYTVDAVTGLIRNTFYKRGTTNTGLGLKLAEGLFEDRAREFSKKAIMLLTDGRSNHFIDVCDVAKRLRDKDIEIYTFGISKHVDMDELLCIASRPEFVFPIASFESLERIRHLIRFTSVQLNIEEL